MVNILIFLDDFLVDSDKLLLTFFIQKLERMLYGTLFCFDALLCQYKSPNISIAEAGSLINESAGKILAYELF